MSTNNTEQHKEGRNQVTIHNVSKELLRKARIAAMIANYPGVGPWIDEAIAERLEKEARR